MMIPRMLLVSSVAFLWLGCGLTQDESMTSNASTTALRANDDGTTLAAKASATASNGGGDNGTTLTATATAEPVVCSETGGTATFDGVVTTTGSVDSVEVTAQLDGGARQLLLTLLPQDFNHDGRVKTASYSVSLSGLADGTHSVVLCFTESGAQGREPKEYCTAAISVTVACASTCADEQPFGDIVGNPSLCKGNGPPHIPIHVKGDFGEAPALHIAGPSGYALDATMNHAGESCVYQYNWDTAGNGGAGTYTFHVTGNGHVLDFSAELQCR